MSKHAYNYTRLKAPKTVFSVMVQCYYPCRLQSFHRGPRRYVSIHCISLSLSPLISSYVCPFALGCINSLSLYLCLFQTLVYLFLLFHSHTFSISSSFIDVFPLVWHVILTRGLNSFHRLYGCGMGSGLFTS